MREGQMKYAQCTMYARNYSEILRTLSANGLSLASFQNDSRFLEIVANESTETAKCTDGWNYDRQMFPNTVVMQVLKSLTKNRTTNLILNFFNLTM